MVEIQIFLIVFKKSIIVIVEFRTYCFETIYKENSAIEIDKTQNREII